MYSVVSEPNKVYGICENIEDAEFLFDDVNEMSDGELDNLRIVKGIAFSSASDWSIIGC